MGYEFCINAAGTALKTLSIHNWRDITEILLLSAGLNWVIYWLKKDKEKKLVEYFYFYNLFILLTYAAHLEIINTLIFIATPVVAMLFMLIHQHNLQKNFISIKRTLEKTQNVWIAELIQSMLVAMNKNKSLICVIERGESLDNFLQAPSRIDSLINQYFLTTLFESPVYEKEKLLWCNQKGRLLSYNVTWKKHEQDIWFSEDIQQEHHWKQDAFFYSTKFDCIVFKLRSTHRTFDLIIDGAIAENLSAAQLAHVLSIACNTKRKPTSNIELKDCHGINFKKSYQKQQLL